MKRIYKHYRQWEDYKLGMYRVPPIELEDFLIRRSEELLKNKTKLFLAMKTVMLCWDCSADLNLSARCKNRQAWLGQAACCMVFGTPENLVKEAWHKLTETEQCIANKIADKVIAIYELNYNKENA